LSFALLKRETKGITENYFLSWSNRWIMIIDTEVVVATITLLIYCWLLPTLSRHTSKIKKSHAWFESVVREN